MSRRTSAVKIAGILLASVGLVVVAAVVWIRAIESRRWKEMEDTLVSLEQEAMSPSVVRPVLVGDPVAGNAWDHYPRAWNVMKGQGGPLLGSYISRAPNVDRDQVLQTLRRLEPALADLRKGARCGVARRAVDWRNSATQEVSLYALTYLAVAQAREWAASGRVRDAVELLLDGARFSADLASQAECLGYAVSMAGLYTALDEIRDLMEGGKLGPADLQLLESGLDRLDGSFPEPGPALMNGALAMGWELHRAPSLKAFVDPIYSQMQAPRPAIPTWRFAFSERLLIADWFGSQLDRSRRVAATDRRLWVGMNAAARQADREVAESKNGLAQVFNLWDRNEPHFYVVVLSRERRAHLRLLRAAVRFRATGEVSPLGDPFGAGLTHVVKDGRLKVWSVGRDGVDDGGSGEWRARAGKDIVLEVSR
jgi:hypothetical protein